MFKRRKDRQGGGDGPHEVFLRLRGQLLEVDPAELELSPSPRLPRVWAVLMEMGLDTGTASLVAVADGTPRSRKENSSTAEANWRRCSTPATRSLPSSGSSTNSGSDRDTGA